MAATTSGELILDEAVRAFLKRHEAEGDLRKVWELVQASFPELRRVEVMLQEDPDEANYTRIVLYVHLPATHPDTLLQEQLRYYHSRLVQELPLDRCPLLVLLTDFVQE